ncbi:MAG: hypothetical protein HYX27_06065 [Acidobacteria bacterium]|nr:hypothetical protein [Acidobacteriota bacterium]
MRWLLASLVLVIPCFWQGHVQAGDLGSHMYNVWLAQLIERGQAPGLYLAPIRTNVLFDLWAARLAEWTGFGWGERLAVSTLVLTFFWGSWTWIRRMTHASVWPVAPLLAMFAYGWVFHVGFMNFYWSMGLCVWALAMAEGSLWERRLWWVLLLPAAAAHMLPVGWAGALWVYGQAMTRTKMRWKPWLLLGGVALAVAATAVLRMRYVTFWSGEQALAMLGFDQLWLYDMKYFAVAAGFLGVWALGLLFVLHSHWPGRLGYRKQVHYLVLTSVGVLLVPWVIHLPSFVGPLSYITQRMSLAAAILMCALLPLSTRARRLLYAGVPLAAVYFGMLYRDTAELNDFEDRLYQAVRTVAAGSRVVAPFEKDEVRVFAYGHIVDRACIGHCFSYANYEAATTQFRVRARGPNGIVVSDNGASLALQTARYTVNAEDAPLYYFRWIPAEKRFELRVLREGDKFQ